MLSLYWRKREILLLHHVAVVAVPAAAVRDNLAENANYSENKMHSCKSQIG